MSVKFDMKGLRDVCTTAKLRLRSLYSFITAFLRSVLALLMSGLWMAAICWSQAWKYWLPLTRASVTCCLTFSVRALRLLTLSLYVLNLGTRSPEGLLTRSFREL